VAKPSRSTAGASDSVAEAIEDARRLFRRRTTATALQRLYDLVRLNPDALSARVALADAHLGIGDYRQAALGYEHVIDRDPGNPDALVGLATCLGLQPSVGGQLRSTRHVLTCLTTAAIDPDLAAAAAALLVRHSPDPLQDPLLEVLLRRAPVVDLALEDILTGERRRLCLTTPHAAPPLADAITAQGRLNGQSWAVSPQEESALATAPEWVREMYRPGSPDDDIEARAAQVPALRSAASVQPRATSTAVRELYEEHPYPSWRGLTRRRPVDLREHLRIVGEDSWDPSPTLDHPRLLSAGCGTGRELLAAAASWKPVEAAGVDLSRSSLAHAGRMAERLGLNVSLHQADLMDLADCDRRFDVIICTGVLHHLSDPLAGWRILTRLLRPGGVMLVGLYSAVARRGVAVAQTEIRALGLPPTPAGIRAARAHLGALPQDHPARDCTALSDYYTAGGCRDLLFHVQERHFTLPEVAEALEHLGLVFRGFEVEPAVRHRMTTLFGTGTRLELWDAFEQLYPWTFIGMYQFWCQLADPCSDEVQV
jgi:SAM-dependent methyltransferase